MVPPCGTPISLTSTFPSSMMPALRNRFTIRCTRLSPIRWAMNRIIHSWSTLSKNPLMSASTIQFTRPLSTVSLNARSASWQPRFGRNPYESAMKSCFIYLLQYAYQTPLHYLILQTRESQWALFGASWFGYVHPGHLGGCNSCDGVAPLMCSGALPGFSHTAPLSPDLCPQPRSLATAYSVHAEVPCS